MANVLQVEHMQGTTYSVSHQRGTLHFVISAMTGDVRLVGGESHNQGRLEVYLNDQWGSVCDDGFSVDLAGDIACKQLGYIGAVSFTSGTLPGDETLPINIDDIECTDQEQKLSDCGRAVIHNCIHPEDVNLVCSPVRLP